MKTIWALIFAMIGWSYVISDAMTPVLGWHVIVLLLMVIVARFVTGLIAALFQ